MRIFSLLFSMPLLAVAFVNQDSSSDFSSSGVYFADEITMASEIAKKHRAHSLPHFLQLTPKPPSHSPPIHVLHQAFSEAPDLSKVSWDEEEDVFHNWAWDEI
ncbi:unnamed protein product [Cylindrotheca closterium]|uniref:Uncharacterized protein n=1 Tax=Cylindrotheca closterium TaxID=2856 RepID=A0AAD2JNA4_9STRA|nr:unnamed protein product [Cylindrotheca closterium]